MQGIGPGQKILEIGQKAKLCSKVQFFGSVQKVLAQSKIIQNLQKDRALE